jgi:capsular exopolysaccharide synthesis family protein
MDFWRTTEILSKRKWLILLSVIAASAMSWGATRLIGSRWSASVQFISKQESSLVSGSQAPGQENLEASDPGFEAARAQALIYATLVRSAPVLKPALEKAHPAHMPTDLMKSIEFVAIAPRLYQLVVSSGDKNDAANLANALADSFLDYYHKLRTEQAKETIKILDRELRQADRKLVDARNKLDTYRNLHQLVGAVATDTEAAIVRLRETRQRLEDINQKIADSQARLNHLTAELAITPKTTAVQMASSPQTLVMVKQLQDAVTKAEAQLKEARSRYTDEMPAVQRALKAVEEAKSNYALVDPSKSNSMGKMTNPAYGMLQQETHNLKIEIVGNQALAATMRAAVVNAQRDLDRFKGIDGPTEALQSEVAAQTESRNNLSARLHSARMMLDVVESQGPIQIINRVGSFNAPANTTAGRTQRLIMLAALCALLATSGLVIAFDTVDRRLRTVKEAEIALPAPVLAAIPQPMGEVTYASLGRATELHPQSLHSEAYRFLALDLLGRQSPPVNSLMICSAKAEQGSTTALTNLGISLAQSGKRVVIVDANIRTPELHHVFEMDNSFGFTNLLKRPDEESLNRAMKPTSLANLHVITSGPQPNNPWMAFRSPALREVSRKLKERADYILFDTPSSIIFTDALNLASVVDAAYLSVRALEPVTGGEERLAKLLDEAGVPILGCILNDVPAAVVAGYHNYQHYYQPSANTTVVTTDPPGQGADGKTLESWIDLPVDERADDSDSRLG